MFFVLMSEDVSTWAHPPIEEIFHKHTLYSKMQLVNHHDKG